jgi:hypothetical protein
MYGQPKWIINVPENISRMDLRREASKMFAGRVRTVLEVYPMKAGTVVDCILSFVGENSVMDNSDRTAVPYLAQVAASVMGTVIAVHESTHYPVRTDYEIHIITVEELRLEQMKLDKLRKEDKIQRRPTPPPKMQTILRQVTPRPVSRDALSLPPSMVFLPPKPETPPKWGAQVKVVFRDIRGMQRKTEVAFINKYRQNDNWDRDASRVFQLLMKVIDERTFVEAEDVLACRPDNDTPPQNAAPMSFKDPPTSPVGAPIAIRLERWGQVVPVHIASNSSPKAVEDKGRLLCGQAVEFKESRTITWIPNKVYHMQCATSLPVSIVTADVRANISKPGPVQVECSVIVVDGRDQFREDHVFLQNNATAREIMNAWTSAVLHSGNPGPQHATFPEVNERYRVHDAQGREIKQIQKRMDVFVSIRRGDLKFECGSR